MATNGLERYDGDNFNSLDDSAITLMEPGAEIESHIQPFREKMEMERRAMAVNFQRLKDIIDIREREFTEQFDLTCSSVEKEMEEREAQLKSIQQTVMDMTFSMKENSLISTLQIAQQPLMEKLQQLTDELHILSDLKVQSDIGAVEQSIRLFGDTSNPVEELEFKDAQPPQDPVPPIPPAPVQEAAPVPDKNGVVKLPYTARKKCVWSSYAAGFDIDGLSNPRGVTSCDVTGNVYVADHGNHRIQVCTPDGRPQRSIMDRGMSYPLYITIGLNHNELFVSSHYALIKFSSEGEFLAKCAIQKSSYRGIDKDEKGNIYACEWRNYTIVVHEPANLRVESRITLQTVDISSRRKLNDVKIREKQLYILFAYNGFWNSFNYKEFPLQVYSFKGEHLKSIASGSILQKPVCLCIDVDGNFLVSDYWKHVVFVISATGALLGSIGKSGDGKEDASYPTGICLNKEGTLLVVSTGRTEGTLQAF